MTALLLTLPVRRPHAVLIAAITSCTNTSNPGVLLAAGLPAKKAVEAGPTVAPHIKTSLAPGLRIVTEYLTKAGLLPYLEQFGFTVAAYGMHHPSATPGTWRLRSTRRSPRMSSSAAQCSAVIATSRRGSTRT